MTPQISHTKFGDIIRLCNSSGAFVELCNYGARIIRCCVPDVRGKIDNVVVGYSDVGLYDQDEYYRGAIIGRFANRIGGARFNLDGKEYHVTANEGRNCNHGGKNGFNRKSWSFSTNSEGNGVSFVITSLDGDEGFPGKVTLRADYVWSDDNRLTLHLYGETDRPTLLNPTNHAYFNLSGGKGTIENHLLKIKAEQYLETDNEYIPTGRLASVANTAMDFRQWKSIGEDMPKPFGYNVCYTGSEALVFDPFSGRTLHVASSLPGILLYTAGYCPTPFESFCLEPQYWPDCPNHPSFPLCRIDPAHPYSHFITYDFGIRKD